MLYWDFCQCHDSVSNSRLKEISNTLLPSAALLIISLIQRKNGKAITVVFLNQKPHESGKNQKRKEEACQGECKGQQRGGFNAGLSKVIKTFSLLFNVVYNSSQGKANQ